MPVVYGTKDTIDANASLSRSQSIANGLLNFAKQRESLRDRQHREQMESIEADQKVKLSSIGSEAMTFVERNVEKNAHLSFDQWKESEGYQETVESFGKVPGKYADQARQTFENRAREAHSKFNSAHVENQASIAFGNGFKVMEPEVVNDYYDTAMKAGKMRPDTVFMTALGALKNNANLEGLKQLDQRTDLTQEQHLAIKRASSLVAKSQEEKLTKEHYKWIKQNKESTGYLQGLHERGIFANLSEEGQAEAEIQQEKNDANAKKQEEAQAIYATGGNSDDLQLAGWKKEDADEFFDKKYRAADLDEKMDILTRDAYNLPQTALLDMTAGLRLVQPKNGATSADMHPRFKAAYGQMEMIIAEIGNADAVKQGMGETFYNDARMLQSFVRTEGDLGEAYARLAQYKYDTMMRVKQESPPNWKRDRHELIHGILQYTPQENYSYMYGVLSNSADAYMVRGITNRSELKRLLTEDSEPMTAEIDGKRVFNAGVYASMLDEIANPYIGKNYGVTANQAHSKVIELYKEDLRSSGLSDKGVRIHFNAYTPTRIIIQNEDGIQGVHTVAKAREALMSTLKSRKETLAQEDPYEAPVASILNREIKGL